MPRETMKMNLTNNKAIHYALAHGAVFLIAYAQYMHGHSLGSVFDWGALSDGLTAAVYMNLGVNVANGKALEGIISYMNPKKD